MPPTASKLRQDVYRILDQVLATGVPIEIVRKGGSFGSSPTLSLTRGLSPAFTHLGPPTRCLSARLPAQNTKCSVTLRAATPARP